MMGVFLKDENDLFCFSSKYNRNVLFPIVPRLLRLDRCRTRSNVINLGPQGPIGILSRLKKKNIRVTRRYNCKRKTKIPFFIFYYSRTGRQYVTISFSTTVVNNIVTITQTIRTSQIVQDFDRYTSLIVKYTCVKSPIGVLNVIVFLLQVNKYFFNPISC